MVEVIGHRGASTEAPENPLAANDLAFQQKADGIEVDVRLTKDNRLVCMHDKSAFRTAGKKNLIKESTLNQLKSLDVGKWKGEKWSGEAIPSLHEVLSEMPLDKKIFIDVKEGIETIPTHLRFLKSVHASQSYSIKREHNLLLHQFLNVNLVCEHPVVARRRRPVRSR